MDPLTQGVLGASLPQSISQRKHTAIAGLFGLLGGMAADLDVLIRSNKKSICNPKQSQGCRIFNGIFFANYKESTAVEPEKRVPKNEFHLV